MQLNFLSKFLLQVHSAPSNMGGDEVEQCVHPGQIVELNNVIQGRRYSVETDDYDNRLTVWGYSINGEIMTYGNSVQGASADFVAPYSGTYYIHITDSYDCTDWESYPDQSTCKELTVKRIEYPYYQTYDPNPKPIDQYDNNYAGFAWYRYSELGGVNTKYPHQIFKKEPTSTKDVKVKSTISVYPNPARTSLTIEGIDNAEYFLFDVSGQLILSGRFSHQNIDVSRVAAGTYFLRLQSPEASETFPVVIQR